MKKSFLNIFLYSFVTYIILFTNVSYAFPASSSTIYNGIDVSEWQGEINFSEVSRDNIQVVYIKASEGTNYIDPFFEDNYNNAKSNGLKVGFYHYLNARSQSDAIAEANFFVSVIKGLSPDCRLAMDFEQFGDLNNEEINNISRTFLEEVQRLSGKDVIIYSDVFNAQNTFSSSLANDYPVWIAEYGVSEPSNGNWDVWYGFQYTNQGNISGISGYVDRDYFTENILLSDTSNIPSNTTTSSNQNSNYIIVQSGNTLSQIAQKYNTSYTYLAQINNISNPNLIFVGEKIYVPTLNNTEVHDINHTLYIVQYGDTLSYISELYGVSIEDIVKLNNISNPNLIYAGEILRIFN